MLFVHGTKETELEFAYSNKKDKVVIILCDWIDYALFKWLEGEFETIDICAEYMSWIKKYSVSLRNVEKWPTYIVED